jgi:hypothetical protein
VIGLEHYQPAHGSDSYCSKRNPYAISLIVFSTLFVSSRGRALDKNLKDQHMHLQNRGQNRGTSLDEMVMSEVNILHPLTSGRI